MFLTDEVIEDGRHLLLDSLGNCVGGDADWLEEFILLWALGIALEGGEFGDAGDDLGVDLFDGLCAVDDEVAFWIHHGDL